MKMSNESFKTMCVMSAFTGYIGGTCCLIKDYFESGFQLSWKQMAKSFGRGFAVGAALGVGSGILKGIKKEKDNSSTTSEKAG